MLEWSCLSYDQTDVSTRSIDVELEATLEEDRIFCGLPEGVAAHMTQELIWSFRMSQDV